MFIVDKNSFLFPQSILDIFFTPSRDSYSAQRMIYQLRLQLTINYFHITSRRGYQRLKIHASKTLQRKKKRKRVGREGGSRKKKKKEERKNDLQSKTSSLPYETRQIIVYILSTTWVPITLICKWCSFWRAEPKVNGDCYHCHFEGILHGNQSILKYFPDLVSKMSELSECVQQLNIILKSDKNVSGIYALLILR